MPKTVAILGVGLIGASLGLALRRFGDGTRVLGIGRNPDRLGRAQTLGAIDSHALGIGPELAQADVLVLCSPVDCIAQQAIEAVSFLPPNAWITDAGSTKAEIVEVMRKAGMSHRFIGSHPIAGSEKQGAEHAFADLFAGKRCIVTPVPETPTALVESAHDFWSALSMEVVLLDPAEHDRILARASHLPHLLSSVLAATVPATDWPMAGTGLRDMTRLAAGDPGLWRAIFEQNRTGVQDAMVAFELQWAAFRHAIEAGDGAAIERLLREGKERRDGLGT